MELSQGLGGRLGSAAEDDVPTVSRLHPNSQQSHGTLQRSLKLVTQGQKGKFGHLLLTLWHWISPNVLHLHPAAVQASSCLPRHARNISRGTLQKHWTYIKTRSKLIQACLALGGTWEPCCVNEGSLQKRDIAQTALKLDANDGSLWGNYGNVLRDQKQLEEFCQAFQEGLKRAPGSKGLLQGLAISLGSRGSINR